LLIARLIADPAQSDSSLEQRVESLRQMLAGEGMQIAMARLLETSGDVLQLALPDGDPAKLARAIDASFMPTDVLVTQQEIQIPRLFVSDMDSTMIGQECIDELADYAGLKEKVADITERAMQGELDFANALRERVGLLAGLEEGAIAQCLAERIKPMSGAKTLVATLRAHGCRTVLVTGGFHHFADPVAEDLGFERVVGNRLSVADGMLTGELNGSITDSGVKKAALEEEMAQLGEGATSLATGDGANDIPMLQAASYGIAYHAKPKAKVAANGWIDQGDLTSVLKLLGIPQGDWISN